MKLQYRQLSLNNVVGLSTTIDLENDIFEQTAKISRDLKELLIQNNFYSASPVIFEYNPFDETGEITLLSTIGNKVTAIGDNKEYIFFKERLTFTTDYYYRHYDQEEKIPYDEIKKRVEDDNGILLTIYHVLLDLDGDIVVDLYCEVDRL